MLLFESCEDASLLSVMFHVFPIVRRIDNMTGITGTAHIIGAYIYTHVDNSRTHRLKWDEGEDLSIIITAI